MKGKELGPWKAECTHLCGGRGWVCFRQEAFTHLPHPVWVVSTLLQKTLPKVTPWAPEGSCQRLSTMPLPQKRDLFQQFLGNAASLTQLQHEVSNAWHFYWISCEKKNLIFLFKKKGDFPPHFHEDNIAGARTAPSVLKTKILLLSPFFPSLFSLSKKKKIDSFKTTIIILGSTNCSLGGILGAHCKTVPGYPLL